MFPTQEHIQAAQDAAKFWEMQTGVYIWPSVTLAQAVIESANWTRLSGKNNGFGIKATKAQIAAGKATYVWTQEVVNGERVKVKAWFADFDSLTDAYKEHARLLATSRYYVAGRHANGPKQFISDIGPTYATAPNYAAVIIATMDRLSLYQYDAREHRQLGGSIAIAPPPKPKAASTATAGAVIVGVGAAASGAAHIAGSHYLGYGALLAAGAVALACFGLALAFAIAKPAPVTAANTAAPPAAPVPAAPLT